MQEYKKKILGSGATTLIIWNYKIKDITKIVKSFEGSGLLLKGVSETIQNEVKEKTGGFLSMLLGIVSPSLLENMFPGKEINRAGEGFVRVGYGPKRSLIKDF